MRGSLRSLLPGPSNVALWSAGVTIYLLLPSPTPGILTSWPLSPIAAVTLVVAGGITALATRFGAARWSTGTAAVIAIFLVLRLLASTLLPPTGWTARYYANDAWQGEPEWSSEFRLPDATRVDRSLSFSGRSFPTHYLNGARFEHGVDREVALPMTVEWSGLFEVDAADVVEFEMAATGWASIAFDQNARPLETGVASGAHAVGPGAHRVVVRYRKPAGSEGLFRLALRARSTGESLRMFPNAAAAAQPSIAGLPYLAMSLDIVCLAILAATGVVVMRAAWHSTWRLNAAVAAALFLVLGMQGFFAALPFARAFHSLTGGDDWLGFESRARDVLQHGLLMTLGKPLGEGAAYFYHPFYSYWLALVHWLTGESLFGPVFANFLLLAATATMMWWLLRDLFGPIAALSGVAALLLLFEIDFIRYYTVTLLSENLYIFTVTACLIHFARWASSGSRTMLLSAGVWAGISAATRPAMMMFFVPAVLVVVALELRRAERRARVATPLIFAGSWLAAVAPFTVRNWIVARRLVLISDSLGGTFIVHNVPPPIDPAPYLERYSGGILASFNVLWQIVWDHPAAFVALQAKKLGFSLGMVHWYADYRPHPELVMVTLLFITMLVLSRTLRSPMLWPVYAFVIAHVASMALTSPWNYGYRLILPPFVYTTTLAVAAAAAAVEWKFAPRRFSASWHPR